MNHRQCNVQEHSNLNPTQEPSAVPGPEPLREFLRGHVPFRRIASGAAGTGTAAKRQPAKRRRYAFFLALVLALCLISWPVLAEEPATANASGTADPETLRVGMEVNYAPFNWSQANDRNNAYPVSNSPGEYAIGYDVWMAEQIAEALGKKLEVVKIEWDGLPPALESGKIDAIIAGMSPTAERKQTIDFSDAYYQSDLVMVVRKDGPYTNAKSLEDFAGAKITGQLNTFHYAVIDQIPGVQKEAALESFPTMITALTAGKIDGYVSEKPGAEAARVANDALTYVTFDEGHGFQASLEDTSVAVGVRKGSSLREAINVALASISKDDRAEVMDKMIELSTIGESEKGFWSEVGDIWTEYRSLFLRGTGITLLISVVATALGFLIGLIVQLIRTIPTGKTYPAFRNALVHVLKAILTVYVEVFRGTPMMVQAMLIYYGSKIFFGINMEALTAAFLIVSINTGAYLAETIRGGIDSVPKGQWEAAESVGLSHSQTLFKIVLPQAVKAILPSIGNELIVNIKDTSVLNVISVTELFFVTKGVAGSTLKTFQSYFIAAAIYLLLTVLLTSLLRKLFDKKGQKNFTLKSATGTALRTPAAG